MEYLDCQGMTCPRPVIETRNFLASHPHCTEITVQVDNLAAARNVERFLGTQGFQASVQGADPEFKVLGQRPESGACEIILEDAGERGQKILIMVTQAVMGRGR